jgi:hypothetical protein
MEIKDTTKRINEVLDKADLCFANMTTSVVNKTRFNVDCGDCVCSLYGLLLLINALKRWKQYGNGTAKPNNCITLADKTAIVKVINKQCKGKCGDGSTNSLPLVPGYDWLEFLQETGQRILV